MNESLAVSMDTKFVGDHLLFLLKSGNSEGKPYAV